MRYRILALALTMVLPAVLLSQYGSPRSRRSGGAKANPAPSPGNVPNPTFEGTLKMLNNKEIMLQLQSDQIVSIRRDRKTKFFENGKEIKPSDIDLGTPLAVDVKEDLDLKPIAVKVMVKPSEAPKPLEKSPPGA
jgi:hypothetical protein